MPSVIEQAPARTAPDLKDLRFRALVRELSFEVRKDSIDETKLTVEMAFASEEPVERWYGNEELGCTVDEVDLSRMNDGAPLLRNHDSDLHIGVVEKASVDKDKKCRCVVRFADDDEGKKFFGRVKSGILRKVSVGYRVNELVLKTQNSDGLDTYRATRWTPHEVSLVSIPADNSVGVGRSAVTEQPPVKQSRTMPEVAETAATAAPATATVTRQAAPPMPESQRMNEIRAIGDNFKVPQERVIKALAENEPLDDFRSWVLGTHLKATPVAVPPTIGMNRAERKRYSLQRAIARCATMQPLDGIEREASDACMKKFNREAPSCGFIMPHDVAIDGDRELIAAMLRVSPSLANTRHGQSLIRALQANNFTAAGALIAEDFLGGSFIELLRNRMLLTQLGVGTMSGLVGNVAIPRQSGAATAYWLAEGAAVTVSAQAFAQLAATPKRLAAQTAYSKQLLAQLSLDAEALVRDDLARVIAIAKDLAGIAGTGGAQPLGILNGPTSASDGNAVGTVTFGTTATWANALSFETKIQTANADLGSMQWLTNPTVRNKWKQIAKIGNTFPVFLVNDQNEVNGYPMPITNQVGTSGGNANRVIFGAWAQAMFFDWAGYDVVVDPYTRAAYNEIVVTTNLFTDFGVRHWPSFCISTDSGAQ